MREMDWDRDREMMCGFGDHEDYKILRVKS